MNNRILFIVSMNEENKAGLFLATHNRVKFLRKYYEEYDIYNIQQYDGVLLSSLKKIFNKNQPSNKKSSFTYDDVTYKNLFLKETITSNILKRMGIDFFYFLPLIWKLRKAKKYDLINIHWGYPNGKLGYWLKKIFRIPFVMTLHGSDIHTNPYINKYLYKSTYQALKNSNHNFFVSNKLREQAIKMYGEFANCSTLYNGINREFFKPIDYKEIQILKQKYSLNNTVVGFIGNLVEVKRADSLPQIFKEIQQGFTEEITFLIIGKGYLEKQIEQQLTAYNLRFLFLGKVEQKSLFKYINLMNVMLLPSRQEGLGNVVIEAISCNVKVVASAVGGITEAIGNQELLVEDGERFEERFSEKVISVLKSEHKSNFDYFQHINDNFSLERNAYKELDICKRVICKNTNFNGVVK